MQRLVRLVGFLALVLTGSSVGAIAQSAQQENELSQSHIDAALELLQVSNTIGNVSAMLDTLAPLQADRIKKDHPNLSEKDVSALQSAIKGEILARQDEILLIYATVYARHFSEDELRQLTAFYRSDVGNKFVTSVPMLLNESAPLAFSWVMQVIADAVKNAIPPKPGEKI